MRIGNIAVCQFLFALAVFSQAAPEDASLQQRTLHVVTGQAAPPSLNADKEVPRGYAVVIGVAKYPKLASRSANSSC